MKMKYTICLFVALLSFYSCVDDNGSYDYLQSPSVKITFDEYLYDGVIEEETVIEPNLEFVKGDNAADYTYEWSLNGQIVSTDQVLTYIPHEVATYYILYSVISKATGIRVMKNLQMSVKSPYKTGWAILSEKEGKSLLTQVRDDNQYIDYLDIYKTQNGEELGEHPYKLIEHYYSNTGSDSEILVINHDAKGALELSGNTMKKVLYTTQEFTEGVPNDFVVKNVANLLYTDVLLTTNGEIYLRQVPNQKKAGFHSAPYSSVPAHFNKGMKIAKLVPGNYSKTLHTLMYDEKNHRLLCLNSIYNDYSGDIHEVSLSGLEDKTLLYVSAYYPSDWSCKYMLLLKDGNGKYSVKTFAIDVDYGSVYVSDETDYSFPGETYLTERSKFECSRDYSGSYLFFTGGASNDAIYYYENSTEKITLFTTCNSEITDIQLNYGSTTLGVGMKDGFVVYDVDESVIVSGEVKKLHEVNNIGEVVDVIYRYGSPSKMYR